MTTDTGTDARRHNFFIIDNEAIDDYELNPQEGWLYVVILRHINRGTGVAFPSLATLAMKTNMTVPTVTKYLKSLEEKKLINREQQRDPETQAHKSTHYKAMALVKEVNKASKPALQALVKEVNTNNTKDEKDEDKHKDQKIAPDGAEGQNSVDPKVDDPKPVQPHIAIIDAYWAGLPGGQPIRDTYGRHVKVATALVAGAIEPDDITRFLAAVYDPDTDVFEFKKWHQKPILFEVVADMIKLWKEQNAPPPEPEIREFDAPDWMIKAGAIGEDDSA